MGKFLGRNMFKKEREKTNSGLDSKSLVGALIYIRTRPILTYVELLKAYIVDWMIS